MGESVMAVIRRPVLPLPLLLVLILAVASTMILPATRLLDTTTEFKVFSVCLGSREGPLYYYYLGVSVSPSHLTRPIEFKVLYAKNYDEGDVLEPGEKLSDYVRSTHSWLRSSSASADLKVPRTIHTLLVNAHEIGEEEAAAVGATVGSCEGEGLSMFEQLYSRIRRE